MPIDNFGIVCRSNGHTLYRSAQPDQRGLIDVYANGIRTIYKLNDGFDAGFEGLTMRAPLAGWSFWYETKKIISICEEINESLKMVDTLIHCQHGRDRTGLVAAAFMLLYNNSSLEFVNMEREVFGVDGIIRILDMPENKVLEDIIAMRGN